MSRNRRNRGESTDNILDQIQDNEMPLPGNELTTSDIANEGYGSQIVQETFGSVGREKIRQIAIETIQPDPLQPRRATPSAVRQYYSNSNPAAMQHFFAQWLQEIKLERGGESLDVDAYLRGDETDRAPAILTDEDDESLDRIGSDTQPGPLETAFMKIIDLAASIRRDGLTNPITVARHQQREGYVIETGERRWLAYYLLNWRAAYLLDEDTWQKIPARIVDGVSIWRQASENNTRDDLNAISKARQFALLLMDLYGMEAFQTAEVFDMPQQFYAQVEDGSAYRIPHGSSESLLNAMGLQSANQLRQYRRLLRLPEPVWILADDLNWSESFIRKDLLSKAHDDDDLIQLALLEAKRSGYSVSWETDYAHLLADPGTPDSNRPSHWDKFLNRQLPGLERTLRRLKGQQRQRAINHLRDLLASLEE